MPDAAISAGLIDFAVPVEEMSEKLADFAKSADLLENTFATGASPDQANSFDEALSEIYAIIRNRIGHDFSGYKTKTFVRRVQRCMRVNQIKSIEAYVEQLRQELQEVAALFRDLLINVTNFFRDADAFQMLATSLIPKLFEARRTDDRLGAVFKANLDPVREKFAS